MSDTTKCPHCQAELRSPNAPHRGWECGSDSRERSKACRIRELESQLATTASERDFRAKAYFDAEQELGNALYGTSGEGLPLWGDHVLESLADEAVRRLAAAQAERDELKSREVVLNSGETSIVKLQSQLTAATTRIAELERQLAEVTAERDAVIEKYGNDTLDTPR